MRNPWIVQNWGSKSIHIESTMTILTRVWMTSLVSTMSIHQQKELNVIKGSICNCPCLTWKSASHTMAAKVSQITSWCLICPLPWTQCKRRIPIRSMGCAHTHWRIPTIEGWGNPSSLWNVVEKTKENNRKARKTSRAVSQTPIVGPEHDNIQAQWASNILLENMFQKVWWCKWSWTIFCPMNYSNGGWHTQARGSKRSHAALRCCWKSNVLLSTHAKASRRKRMLINYKPNSYDWNDKGPIP